MSLVVLSLQWYGGKGRIIIFLHEHFVHEMGLKFMIKAACLPYLPFAFQKFLTKNPSLVIVTSTVRSINTVRAICL